MTKISKKNEVYLQVDTEPSVARMLSDYFTFEVHARFMPAYRNRIWDGKIRLFSPSNGELYVGLLPYLTKYLQDFDEDYAISEELQDEKTIDRKVLDGFIRQLKLRSRTNPYDLVITRLTPWTSQLENIDFFCLVLLLRASH